MLINFTLSFLITIMYIIVIILIIFLSFSIIGVSQSYSYAGTETQKNLRTAKRTFQLLFWGRYLVTGLVLLYLVYSLKPLNHHSTVILGGLRRPLDWCHAAFRTTEGSFSSLEEKKTWKKPARKKKIECIEVLCEKPNASRIWLHLMIELYFDLVIE